MSSISLMGNNKVPVKPIKRKKDSAPSAKSKKGASNVHKSDQDYRVIFHHAGSGMAILNESGCFLDANPAFARSLGHPLEAILGRSLDEFISVSDWRKIESSLFRVVKGELSESQRDIQFLRGGIPSWCSANLSPLPGNQNEGHALLHLQDISRRKLVEEKHRVLEKAVMTTRVGITVTDLNGDILFTNPSEASMHGYSVDELIGQPARILAPPSVRGKNIPPERMKVWQRESLNIRKDGTTFPVQLISDLVSDEDGRPLALVTICEDITHRKNAEDDLRTSEERFRAAFQTSPDGIGLVRQKRGVFVDINDSFSEMTGLSRDNVIGRRWMAIDLWEDSGVQRKILRRLRAEKEIRNFDVRFRRAGGPICAGLLSANRITLEGEPHFIIILRDIEELKQAEMEIRDLAFHDTLTGLPNRTSFKEELEKALAQAARDEKLLALLFLDLDHFKDVNDTLGHDRGDFLLQMTAERLRHCVRRSDHLTRFGGDEFVILLTGIKEERDTSVVARNILHTLSMPFQIDDKDIFVSASLGIVFFPDNGSDADTLLRHADLAMYEAKKMGRNTFRYFSKDMDTRIRKKLVAENNLRRALERKEISIVYQPQVDIRNGILVGLEALTRWRRSGKWIPPENFIPLAEATGLIFEIGEWILRESFRQQKKMADQGHSVRFGVNISGRQLKQPDFVDSLEKLLQETGANPEFIDLELTESVLMEVSDEIQSTLAALKKLSINLTIDDFGTGYSSLGYLKDFPVDRIKIDRKFVKDIASNPSDAAISEAIVALARSLDLNVIAEGVENFSQVKFLRSLDCNEMQGFLFGKPMCAKTLKKFFDENIDQMGRFPVPSAAFDAMEWSNSPWPKPSS